MMSKPTSNNQGVNIREWESNGVNHQPDVHVQPPHLVLYHFYKTWLLPLCCEILHDRFSMWEPLYPSHLDLLLNHSRCWEHEKNRNLLHILHSSLDRQPAQLHMYHEPSNFATTMETSTTLDMKFLKLKAKPSSDLLPEATKCGCSACMNSRLISCKYCFDVHQFQKYQDSSTYKEQLLSVEK